MNATVRAPTVAGQALDRSPFGLNAGARVSLDVSSPGRQHVAGGLLGLRDSSFLVENRSGKITHVPLSSVTRLRVGVARCRNQNGDVPVCDYVGLRGHLSPKGAPVGGAIGATVGAIVGALFPTTDWREVALPHAAARPDMQVTR